MLTTLDRVLRSALHENGGTAEAESFFRDLYVPLARVAGFLKTLRSQNPTDWPHMAWSRPVPASLAKQRLGLLFRQLAVAEDLDAEEAVADLTRAELSAGPRPRPGASPRRVVRRTDGAAQCRRADLEKAACGKPAFGNQGLVTGPDR